MKPTNMPLAKESHKGTLPQSASLTAPSTERALTGRPFGKAIYALGFFDGVHLGHGELLKACRELADEAGCLAGVITFATHPDTLVLGQTPPLINTLQDREKLLRTRFAMDTVVALPFDNAMRTMPWQDFIQMLVTDYHAAGLVCGDDFRFGNRGEGTAALLREDCQSRGLCCRVIPPQQLEGQLISSTYIRTLLESGQMEKACRFLGHPHVLTGTVVPGKQLGRTIGIPTANLELPEGVVSLRHGVYACMAVAEGKRYPAVTNVGTRPTVDGKTVTVEPWLLDFAGDLYGKELCLEFYRFLRPEQKFPSLEELEAEIRKNAQQAKEFFEKY